MSSDLNKHVALRAVGAMVGQTGAERPIFTHPQATRILGVQLMDEATIALHTANYGSAAVYRKCTNGTSSVLVASAGTGDTAITANKPWDFTLTNTIANLELPANEALSFKWSEAGTGQDLTEAVVAIHYAIGYGGGVSQRT